MTAHTYPRDVRLRDIPLRPPVAPALDKAINILHDKRDEARAARNVTQAAVVGEKHEAFAMNEICHAMMPRMVVPNGDPYAYPRVLDKGKPAMFRYMIGWSNHEIKREYRADTDLQKPFSGEMLRDITMYYDWLRNKSHWSRFFVGPRDPRFLRNFGYILDLQAPSFVVHFMAVAWRMPGEYHEMVLRWAHLVRNGVEPHLAFAIVQDVQGFEIPDGFIEKEQQWRGHRLIQMLTLEGVARVTAGVCQIDSLNRLISARRSYSTHCNDCYNVSHYDHLTHKYTQTWLDVLGDRYKRTNRAYIEEHEDFWHRKSETSKLYSAMFQSPYDEGIIDLSLRTQMIIRKKGWFTHVPTPAPAPRVPAVPQPA